MCSLRERKNAKLMKLINLIFNKYDIEFYHSGTYISLYSTVYVHEYINLSTGISFFKSLHSLEDKLKITDKFLANYKSRRRL